MTEPKKETVSAPSTEKRDTTRIVLPTRTPVPRLPPKIMPATRGDAFPRQPPAAPPAAASPLLEPLPKPPGVEARISILPRPVPAPAPAINMTKTQPLLVHAAGSAPAAPVIITRKPLPRVDAIPRSLCWGLFAISTVIFLIQIWNYVVS
jgi:hypothetical protein